MSADGKTLTLVAATTWSGSYAVEVEEDKIETPDGKKVGEFKAFLSADDKTRPAYNGLKYEPNGNATFTFSEPIDASAADVVTALNVTGPTAVTIVAGDVTLAADNKSFTIVLTNLNKNANYAFTFTGLKDYAGNLLATNPLTVNVVKSDADTTKPTVTSVTSAGVGKINVTFSEKVSDVGATLSVDGAAAAALTTSIDSSKTVITFTATELTAGVRSVVIGGVKDIAGNTMDNATRVVQITADTTAPVYVNHSVKTVGTDQFLVVSYNEEVTVDAAKAITGSYVGSDHITKAITPITGVDLSTGSDKRSIEIKLPATAGDYTFNLPLGIAKDSSNNLSAAKAVSFKLGTAVDSTKPVVSSVVQTNNKIVVNFDREVAAASALNLGNYGIEGISSPFEGNAIFKGDAKTVELTLRADVIGTTGDRNFTVQNVATGAGAVMNTEVKARYFVETVRPTVTSAKVVNETTIELTFSEAIKDTVAGDDFEVYQGASTTALGEVSEVIAGNKVTPELFIEFLK